MSQPYVGEIRLTGFNFAPSGWNFCDGSILAIAEFEVLFNLIGTTYGGDGQQTFQLPDLRGRVPIPMGTSGDGSYVQGMKGGAETVVLNVQELPAHTHLMVGAGVFANSADPKGMYPGKIDGTSAYNSTINTAFADDAVHLIGGGQPHYNMQPYAVLNYIISLYGIYPSQG